MWLAQRVTNFFGVVPSIQFLVFINWAEPAMLLHSTNSLFRRQRRSFCTSVGLPRIYAHLLLCLWSIYGANLAVSYLTCDVESQRNTSFGVSFLICSFNAVLFTLFHFKMCQQGLIMTETSLVVISRILTKLHLMKLIWIIFGRRTFLNHVRR